MAQFEFPDYAKHRLIDGVLATLDALEAKIGEPDRWEWQHLARAVSCMETGAYAHAIQELTLSAKRPAGRPVDTAKAEVLLVNPVEALRARLVKMALK
jgi:hypothetical protein